MGRHAKDITGNNYGDWQVIRASEKRAAGAACWWCRCSCGAELEVSGKNLRSGASLRCESCRSKKLYAARLANGTKPTKLPTHGQAIAGKVSLEYKSYSNAKQRCTNPTVRYYPIYGGRGIKFLFTSFEQFFAEVGERPEPKRLYSIDRIDNDGHYGPGNVRWATSREQRLNQRIQIANR